MPADLQEAVEPGPFSVWDRQPGVRLERLGGVRDDQEVLLFDLDGGLAEPQEGRHDHAPQPLRAGAVDDVDQAGQKPPELSAEPADVGAALGGDGDRHGGEGQRDLGDQPRGPDGPGLVADQAAIMVADEFQHRPVDRPEPPRRHDVRHRDRPRRQQGLVRVIHVEAGPLEQVQGDRLQPGGQDRPWPPRVVLDLEEVFGDLEGPATEPGARSVHMLHCLQDREHLRARGLDDDPRPEALDGHDHPLRRDRGHHHLILHVDHRLAHSSAVPSIEPRSCSYVLDPGPAHVWLSLGHEA